MSVPFDNPNLMTAFAATIVPQVRYYEYLEANGANPSDPQYVALRDDRNAQIGAFEDQLVAFVDARIAAAP